MISISTSLVRRPLAATAVAATLTIGGAAPAFAQTRDVTVPTAPSLSEDDILEVEREPTSDEAQLEPVRLPARSLLRARPAEPPPGPPREFLGVSADLSGYGIRHTDAGYDVFGRRDERIGIGLEASYDTLRFGRAGRVAFGLGFIVDRVGPSNDFDDLQVSFEGTSYYALVQARWRQDSVVQPYLTGAVGMTHAQMSIESSNSYGDLSGQANAAFARAGAGLRFLAPFLTVKKNQQPVLAFTLTVEAGGVVGSGLSFDLRSEGGGPGARAAGDPIAVDPVRAGNLGSTATYARIGVGLAF